MEPSTLQNVFLVTNSSDNADLIVAPFVGRLIAVVGIFISDSLEQSLTVGFLTSIVELLLD